MGRAGRYTLSVMVWVAAFAGWAPIVGLVVAGVTGDVLRTGDRVADTVPVGLSALFYVVLPLVPTLAALWFNDWARDGFPSQADRRAGRRASARRKAKGAPPTAQQEADSDLSGEYTVPVVPAISLDVEPLSSAGAHPPGSYPVAPLLRDER